ncbi:MAG: type pilus assembly protein PilA [Patescibacteria group bacterium]|nr:type pilus assembly protein PilA [Patescibacteria group bacterium]
MKKLLITNFIMKINFKKGFTLIELLVVIAIIGVLAAVVIAATNSARNKGSDAAIKANLANARAQAELFYDANGNTYKYASNPLRDVCDATASYGSPAIKGINDNVYNAAVAAGLADPTVAINTLQTSATANCHSNATAWAAQVPLKSGGYWCVDSTGASKSEVNGMLGSARACL